jgi:hypothetical protein
MKIVPQILVNRANLRVQTVRKSVEITYLRILKYTGLNDEVTGGWRTLFNDELHNAYSSPSITRMTKSRRMRLAGNVAGMRDKRNTYKILVGKPEGNTPLGRPRRRWVDNIKINLRMGWYGLD